MTVNTTRHREKYWEFYEKVGSRFPESEIVHSDKSKFSRFGNVMSELRPFANDGKSLLDIGCNDGVYTIPYVLMGGRGFGIDISPSVISKAKAKAERLRLRNVSFLAVNVEDFESSEKHDIALMSEVLEHVTNPRTALRKVRDCLKPNGYLILTTPTPLLALESLITRRGPNLSYIQRLLTRKLKESHSLKSDITLAKYGIRGYVYRHDAYYPNGLRYYVERFGFKCIRYYTLFYRTNRRSLNRLGYVLSKTPSLNLLGNTNVMIFRRR